MADRIFFLLNLLLTLPNAFSEFNVITSLQYPFNNDDEVNIICQHDAKETWIMDAKVFNDKGVVCTMLTCNASSHSHYFMFTMKNLTYEQKLQQYYCQVNKVIPIPIVEKSGKKYKLFPGFNDTRPPDNDTRPPDNDTRPQCPQEFLRWLLIGLLLLLCVYSLSITVIYITKVKSTKNEQNSEYVDMRKVHPRTRMDRDMNHNSHLNM